MQSHDASYDAAARSDYNVTPKARGISELTDAARMRFWNMHEAPYTQSLDEARFPESDLIASRRVLARHKGALLAKSPRKTDRRSYVYR